MKGLFKGLIIGLGSLVLIGVFAVFSGTILWLLWPVAIPTAFPGLVENNVLAASLPWWVAVCLTWIFGILVKSTQTNNNN